MDLVIHFQLQDGQFHNIQPSLHRDLRSRYQVNRDYFHKEIADMGMKVFKPEGAYYMFANISQFGMDDLEFADFLVKNKGVAVVPGSSFYSEKNNKNMGSKYVRFSISQKLETLKAAIERMKKKLI